MWRKLILVVLILAVLALAALSVLTIPGSVPASALAPRNTNLDNGRTMFWAGGCASCHATPKQEDKMQLGGGLALKSPFGTFHVPNISSDPEDVRDLFAFLKTLPPVKSSVPDHELKFPFNIRRATGVWKLLFFDPTPFQPDPSKPAAWNRGAYLVNGPGHCAECHSPRNLLGGIIESQRFAGGPSPVSDDWIPNITPKGIGDYSEADIVEILTTGTMPNGDSVGGPMAEVVRSTEKLSAEDRAAMATYLKSLPPIEGPKPPEKPKEPEQK